MAKTTDLPIHVSPDVTEEDEPALYALVHDLQNIFRQIGLAFRYLDLVDNFLGKEVSIDFTGTGDIYIKNPFRDGRIARRWLVSDVLYSGGVTLTPQRGSTAWSKDAFYLRNSSGGNITAKIIFYG